MPSTCYGGSSSGLYVLRHNPAIPFASVFNDTATCGHVQPYTAFDAATMPQVSFIAPNLCNDEHDCPISTGDAWLAANVPPMLSAGAEVIVTYDEGTTSANGGGNIYTVAVGGGLTASTNIGIFNHYSLLAAIEARYGLTRLNGAASATPLPV